MTPTAPSGVSGAAGNAQSEGRGGLVLVIDDEELVRTSLRQVLVEEGYQVDVASDGADGIRRLRERRPDVILVDLMMPGMNGTQFLRALRDDPSITDIPVVVMTAVTGLTVHPMSLGATDVLEKPFDVDELLGKVALAVYRGRGVTSEEALSEVLDEPHDLAGPVVVPPSPPLDPAERGIVLVVMHDRASLQRLDALLTTRGYSVVALTRITSQLPRLARALEPAAILLDVVEPDDAAIVDALRAMRTDAQLATPIVVFSRHADGNSQRSLGGFEVHLPITSSDVAAIELAGGDDLLSFLDRVTTRRS